MDTKALKQKILDLAIHGKLVPQDPNDEPAKELINHINKERKELEAKGVIKKDKQVMPLDDKYPFSIPDSWVWCRLGCLAFYKKGPFGSSLTKSMFVPKSESTYKVYEQQNAIKKDWHLGHYYIDKDKYLSLKGFAVFPNDIIVSCAGTIGETYVLPSEIENGIINQALMLIRLIDYDIQDFYLLYFDYILKGQSSKESKGTAIKNIPPFAILKNFYIPIPPLAEQKRIVSRVKELFSVIDNIENSKNDILETISKTKDKILDLAVHGKLISQTTNSEETIEQIKEADPKFQTLPKSNYYGQLPTNWVVTVLGELFYHNTGKALNSSNTTGEKRQYITTSNVYWNRFDFSKVKEMPFTDEELDKCTVKKGDLLVCEGGDVGRAAIWNYDYNICIQNHIHRLRPKVELCVPFYLIVLKYLKNNNLIGGKGIGLLGLSSKSLHKLEVPFPPKGEQECIVSKVHQLFSVLDKIQENIK